MTFSLYRAVQRRSRAALAPLYWQLSRSASRQADVHGTIRYLTDFRHIFPGPSHKRGKFLPPKIVAFAFFSGYTDLALGLLVWREFSGNSLAGNCLVVVRSVGRPDGVFQSCRGTAMRLGL
jgi:hypothetical protein